MSERQPESESERAQAGVTHCERALWRAQDVVRSAGEALRRAIRSAASAEGDLTDAERRHNRARYPGGRAG